MKLTMINDLKTKMVKIISSQWTERFMFSVVCATLFTAGLCHWMLNLSYKYLPNQVNTLHVDFTWVFWIGIIVSVYYYSRGYYIGHAALKFDLTIIMFVQVMVLAGVLDYHNEKYATISYTWILPVAYLIGKSTIKERNSIIQDRVLILYYTLAVGIIICMILDFYQLFETGKAYGYESEAQWDQFMRNIWPGFWTNEIQNRCTMEFGATLIVSTLMYAIYIIKKRKALGTSIIILNIFAVYFSVITTGRGIILLMIVGVFSFILCYMINRWGELSEKTIKIACITVVTVIAIIIIAVLLFYNNWIGLYDHYLNSYWSRDGGILRNIRLQMDYTAFINMLKYPLDNYEIMYGEARAHSMLLEYGRVYGLSVFIGLVIFRLMTIKDAITLMLTKGIDIESKYLLIPAFACVNCYYSMEPNGHELRYFWMVGLIINGMIKGIIEKHAKISKFRE